MDRVLLTGASGYLGSRVAAALDAAAQPFQALPGRLEDIRPGSLDCTVVIHCAGALRNRPQEWQATNVEGARCLLAGLPPRAGVLFVSSRAVYADAGPNPVDESAPVAPGDDYGRSKLAAEACIRDSGRPFVIFRASALFGHPARAGTFPDHALECALAGRPLRLATPDRDVDYLDVDWLAQLLVAACRSGPHWGQVLNAAGPGRSLAGMMQALAQVLQRGVGRSPQFGSEAMPLPATPLLDARRCAGLLPLPPQADDAAIYERMLAGRLRPTAPAA